MRRLRRRSRLRRLARQASPAKARTRNTARLVKRSSADGLVNMRFLIMVGPVELKAGQFYPINMQCPNGLEVASEGAFDLTLFLVR